MKKALVVLLALFLIGGLSAQVTYGPKAGITLSKYGYKFADDIWHDDAKFKLGPAIGGMVNIPVASFLDFQPSLMFTKKGSGIDVSNRETGQAVITGYERDRVMYLEVPLNLALKAKIGNFRFQLFAGPYFAYALGGKSKWDYERNVNGNREDVTGEQDIIFKNEIPEDDLDNAGQYQRPFDVGIDFGIGYKIDKVLLNLGYAMGLSNLQPDYPGDDSNADDRKYLNRTIFVTAAWLFGDK